MRRAIKWEGYLLHSTNWTQMWRESNSIEFFHDNRKDGKWKAKSLLKDMAQCWYFSYGGVSS